MAYSVAVVFGVIAICLMTPYFVGIHLFSYKQNKL